MGSILSGVGSKSGRRLPHEEKPPRHGGRHPRPGPNPDIESPPRKEYVDKGPAGGQFFDNLYDVLTDRSEGDLS